jgi:lipopolysaccharide export system protein LptA
MIARLLHALLLSLLFAAAGSAAYITGSNRNNQPIQIKSNALSTDSANRTAIFTGKVSARQGDVTIYCDRLFVFYSEKDKDVEKVEAFGDVRIVQGNRMAQSGHAVYDGKAGKIILDDKPRLFQEGSEVTGKVITYNLDTEQSVVTSDPETRVIVTIQPKQKGKDGSARP